MYFFEFHSGRTIHQQHDANLLVILSQPGEIAAARVGSCTVDYVWLESINCRCSLPMKVQEEAHVLLVVYMKDS